MTCSRRSAEDEALMAAVLGGRKRGFLLEIVEKTEKSDSGAGGCNYPGWKRVLTKGRVHLFPRQKFGLD